MKVRLEVKCLSHCFLLVWSLSGHFYNMSSSCCVFFVSLFVLHHFLFYFVLISARGVDRPFTCVFSLCAASSKCQVMFVPHVSVPGLFPPCWCFRPKPLSEVLPCRPSSSAPTLSCIKTLFDFITPSLSHDLPVFRFSSHATLMSAVQRLSFCCGGFECRTLTC